MARPLALLRSEQVYQKIELFKMVQHRAPQTPIGGSALSTAHLPNKEKESTVYFVVGALYFMSLFTD